MTTNADMMSANDAYVPYTGDGTTQMEKERTQMEEEKENHGNIPLTKT
jgi:hypothetical protein